MKKTKKTSFATILIATIAMVFSLNSCSSDDSNKGGGGGGDPKTLILTASSTSILVNEEITFTIKQDDKTISDAKIYANDIEIENPKTFNEAGTFLVIAKKEGAEDSNPITIRVKNHDEIAEPGTEEYLHRVVIEDFTGTACGPCARVIRALEALENHVYIGNGFPVTYENLLTIGVHVNVPSSDPFTVNNYAYPLFDVYKTKFNYTEQGYWSPFAVVNGEAEWAYPESRNLDHPMSLVKVSSPIGIKIGSTLNSTNGVAVTEVAFSENFENLTYSIVVVEDDLIYSQAGIGANYSHQAVLRAGTTPVIGLPIPAEKSKKGQIFTPDPQTFSYKSVNTDNMRVIVIIRDEHGNILNAQDAKGGDSKDFVIL